LRPGPDSQTYEASHPSCALKLLFGGNLALASAWRASLAQLDLNQPSLSIRIQVAGGGDDCQPHAKHDVVLPRRASSDAAQGRTRLDGIRCQRLCDRPSQWHFPVGKRSPKIGFCAEDVAAARQALAARSAKLGKVMSGSGLIRCEGKDPDGNPFSISNRD
jgi:hypothetical protein